MLEIKKYGVKPVVMSFECPTCLCEFDTDEWSVCAEDNNRYDFKKSAWEMWTSRFIKMKCPCCGTSIKKDIKKDLEMFKHIHDANEEAVR